jgi:hypothetical protein
MRSVRKESGVRLNHIPRAQRKQEDFFPQFAHHKDKSERYVQADEGVHEMSQGHGKNVGHFLIVDEWKPRLMKPGFLAS